MSALANRTSVVAQAVLICIYAIIVLRPLGIARNADIAVCLLLLCALGWSFMQNPSHRPLDSLRPPLSRYAFRSRLHAWLAIPARRHAMAATLLPTSTLTANRLLFPFWQPSPWPMMVFVVGLVAYNAWFVPTDPDGSTLLTTPAPAALGSLLLWALAVASMLWLQATVALAQRGL